MKRRNRLKAAAMASLLAVGGAYALASWDWCPRSGGPAPKIVSRLQASAPLFAGAASVELKPPYPIVAAGYGPPRPEVTGATRPLMAKAVVLREGDVSFGIVAVDLLLVPDDVADEVRAASGLGDAWVVATHTHSSFGGYDRRWVAQLAGTGRFRADARQAVVDGAVAALKAAAAATRPVTVEVSRAELPLAPARSGAASEGQVTRLKLSDVTELLLLAAHPTSVARPATALDPDYPALFPGLVLQGAGGNAAAPDDVAGKVAAAAFTTETLEAPALSVTRAQLTPPPPDATRLVPRLFAMPGKNFLCASAPRTAEVGVLKLGTFTLAAIPAEVTQGAGLELGLPLVSLANGYLGYVEPAEVVGRGEGEAKRQYYDASLLGAFRAALDVAR